MGRIADLTNEEKLDLMADALEPIAVILSDKEIEKAAKISIIKGVQAAIKLHKQEVIEILARIDGKEVADYKYSMLELPVRLFEIVNDGDVLSFFGSSNPMTGGGSLSSPTENTEG